MKIPTMKDSGEISGKILGTFLGKIFGTKKSIESLPRGVVVEAGCPAGPGPRTAWGARQKAGQGRTWIVGGQ